MDASEREQCRAAIHGDREAFEMIIRTHSRTLFAIAYGSLQNCKEAEDAVQDSLIKAWTPDERELANVWLRLPMKNYSTLMQSLDSLGRVENVTVQRQDRTGTQIDEANAPADISIQVFTVRATLSLTRAVRWPRCDGPWRKAPGNHVECAHDWGRDCIPCPVGNCDPRDGLDREANDARAPVGGTVAAATPQRIGQWRRPALGPLVGGARARRLQDRLRRSTRVQSSAMILAHVANES